MHNSDNISRALVFGGGGVAGIAWQVGLLRGFHDHGLDLAADLIVGTSAGACVGAQITSGEPIEALFDRQLEPPEQSKERMVPIDMVRLGEIFGELGDTQPGPSRTAALARVGALAIATPTISEADRLDIIGGRLPCTDWPVSRFIVTAVDASTGELVCFTRNSSVSLLDAVAASCAVPAIWPPVTIGTRRYIDGGMHSPTSADLAVGHQRVLLFVPLGGPVASLDVEIAALGLDPSAVMVVHADELSTAAFGVNPLDPATRAASALAGRRQGASIAHEVGRFWES